jgi:alkyl sulfatase BDS1-like metallo-beta-lactamase superfamily hydrolase
VNDFRVRIDPTKSGETDTFMRFNFSNGMSAGLHIRRAVAECVSVPEKHVRAPDLTFAMAADTWAKLYLSHVTPEDVITSGDLKVSGDAAEVARMLNLFDRPAPEKVVVIPPLALEHR